MLNKLIAVVSLFLVLTGNALAGSTALMGAGKPPVVAAGYQGPCDVVTCTSNVDAFFAIEQCVTNAYSGNVVDVVDAATGNTTGTRLQCSSGVVSALVSGSACTFVTGNACSSLATTCATSCTFDRVYNQLDNGSGNFRDLIAPTSVSSRMTVTSSALNSRACLTGNGTTQFANKGGAFPNPTYSQPVTAVAVAKRTGSFTSTQSIIDDGSTYNMGYRASTNTVGSLSGTITATATDNVFNSIMEISVSGAGNSFMVVNGAAGTSGTVTGSNAGPYIGSFGGSSSFLTGQICEILIVSSALNATQYGNLYTNQRAANRWGTSW